MMAEVSTHAHGHLFWMGPECQRQPVGDCLRPRPTLQQQCMYADRAAHVFLCVLFLLLVFSTPPAG